MKRNRRIIICLFLIVTGFLVHWYSADKNRVETGYSSHFFIKCAEFQRYLLGNIPFSIGDILYGLAFVWIILKCWKYGKALINNKFRVRRTGCTRLAYRLFVLGGILYIFFNLLWGINYNRKGIASQLGLEVKPYTIDDLKDMNGILAEKVNNAKRVLLANKKSYPSNRELFDMTVEAYRQAAFQYPFLQYDHPSIKSSLWGWLGNYTGFTGYYNPFTGEAQLNTTVPKFTQPYTACHEVAHQLGYAKEMEANFVGYLAASASKDTVLHYAVYLDLFTYANRDLYMLDSAASRSYRKALAPEVIADLKEWAAFNARHRNPVEPLISWGYGKFLQHNEQPMGIRSYDKVTAFIIAYYKKFGKI